MGKKNKKIDQREFDRGLMNFAGDAGGSKEAKELLERYKVEGYRHGRTDRGSEGYRGPDDIKKDLAEAMMNDPHTVMTMQNAAMAGNKDAKKFAKKGFKPGAKHLTGAWETLKGLKKEYVGGGGMNGPENIAGLTYATVKADREAQTADYKGMFAGLDDFNAFKDEMKEKATNAEAAAEPIVEKSDRLKGVEERLENAAAGSTNRPPSLFDEENTPPAANDDQKQAASNFLEDYKLDVVKGANLKHDIDEGM